jgi:hypothetical protein
MTQGVWNTKSGRRHGGLIRVCLTSFPLTGGQQPFSERSGWQSERYEVEVHTKLRSPVQFSALHYHYRGSYCDPNFAISSQKGVSDFGRVSDFGTRL